MPVTSTIKPTSIPSLNPNPFLQNKFFITTQKCTKILNRARSLTVNCSRDNSDQSLNLKEALAGLVDERVEELLNREENRDLLDGLEKASKRVEKARQELAEIEKQELEAKLMMEYINKLESRASEIAECQKEILEARTMVEEAEQSLLQIDGNGEREGFPEKESMDIDKDKERLESVKAASISAIIGSLAGLPISFTQVSSSEQLILPLTITFVSCALFGVTFRYTVRRDLDNVQLKNGTSAAFGFVKGLATLGGGQPLELNAESILSHAFDGAIFVSQNLLIFVFAAVGLDYCFRMRLLSPFPIRRSVSRTNSE